MGLLDAGIIASQLGNVTPNSTPAANATSAANPTDSAGVTPATGTTTPTVDASTALTTANPTQTPTASATQSAGYTPVTAGPVTNWNVNPDQTVAGQTTKLIADNSPIIQQARTGALQQANASGLLNSSMAITAGDSAAYQAALPIATADAATASKAAGYNADQANQLNTFNTTQANTAQASNTASANALNISNLSRATQVQIDQMDNASKIQAQQLQNQNAQLLQSNAAAAQLFQTASSAINNVTQNANMDSAAKTAASAQVWGNLQGQLSALGQTSSLNLGDIISGNPYGAGGYAVPASQSAADQKTNAETQAQQAQAQASIDTQQAALANPTAQSNYGYTESSGGA